MTPAGGLLADSLLYLFIGMLAYKILDLLTVALKLEQALTRARRRGLLPLKLRKLAELKRANPHGYHWTVPLQRSIECIHRERAFLFGGPLLLVFMWLGVATVLLDTADPRVKSTFIVGIATIGASITVSLLTLILERYRVLLEHI